MHTQPAPVAAAAAEAGAALTASSDDFDCQLSLALAGCAFEAYNELELEGDAPSLKLTSLNGTEITFVDSGFLSRKFAGLMEVTVHSATGLHAADWWPGSKSDPYAILNIGDSGAATTVVKQSLEPQWGETFHLFVSDPNSQRLTVRVLDEDIGKSDDLLGTAMRGLQDVVDGKEHQLELPLRGAKGAGGTLSLTLRFLPFTADGALAGEAAAQRMGGPVVGSPPSTIMTSQWRSLQQEINAAADAMFDPVAYIDNPATDTQAWLFWNPAARALCIAFRGTEQVKWKDILTDLRLVPTSIDPEATGESALQWLRRKAATAPAASAAPVPAEGQQPPGDLRSALASAVQQRLEMRLQQLEQLAGGAAAARQAGGAGAEAEADEGDGEQIWVHHGFWEAYTSVRSPVLRLLEAALAGEDEPWTLYITGHSLGGALSTLCTFDCARRMWRGGVRSPPRLVHYNYGSPRVGNNAFADEFDRLVPNAWRVANANDAVTLVPRMLGYCHVGHKAALGGEGLLRLQRDSRQELAEGAVASDVALAAALNLPTLTEQLLAKQGESSGVDSADGGGQADGTGTALQQSAPALLSAAAVVAKGASLLASAAQQQAAAAEEGGGAAAAAAAVAGVQDVQTLLEQELAAMSALLDGSALTEHLEPLYLENLRAAAAQLAPGTGSGSGGGAAP